jgi:hypothetical protein
MYNEWKPPEEERMIPKAVWYIAPVVVVGGALGYYLYTHQKVEAPVPAAEVALPPEAATTEPAIKHPVPADTAAPEKPLPALDESDAPLRDSLLPLADAASIDQFLVPENVVRNVVVTIDNLTRSKAPVERWPVKPTPGAFATAQGDYLRVDEANFARYEPFVKLVQSTDAKQLAAIYLHYYPLFQQAYENLGNPDTYFNDRLVEVIDHLLETPAKTGPILLTQPKVFYEFEDPDLEARSAGQKLLLRIGVGNAERIKEKLREFRAVISSAGPGADRARDTPVPPSTG